MRFGKKGHKTSTFAASTGICGSHLAPAIEVEISIRKRLCVNEPPVQSLFVKTFSFNSPLAQSDQTMTAFL
jgi:hypothetical protein